MCFQEFWCDRFLNVYIVMLKILNMFIIRVIRVIKCLSVTPSNCSHVSMTSRKRIKTFSYLLQIIRFKTFTRCLKYIWKKKKSTKRLHNGFELLTLFFLIQVQKALQDLKKLPPSKHDFKSWDSKTFIRCIQDLWKYLFQYVTVTP